MTEIQGAQSHKIEIPKGLFESYAKINGSWPIPFIEQSKR